MADIKIDQLSDAIMDEMEGYAKTTTETVKECVKKAGNTVKKEISANAPKDTGKYAKSWTVSKQREDAESLSLVVHSKNRYQIAHLLEHGHAKRGGGRVEAQVHIKPAEEKGVKQLEQSIKEGIGG